MEYTEEQLAQMRPAERRQALFRMIIDLNVILRELRDTLESRNSNHRRGSVTSKCIEALRNADGEPLTVAEISNRIREKYAREKYRTPLPRLVSTELARQARGKNKAVKNAGRGRYRLVTA